MPASDLRQLTLDFIAAAFEALRREHVIPTPIFHPFVSVGSDYYGGSVMGLSQYKRLEEGLNAVFPQRFAEPLERKHAEFASTYMFSLLEGAVARCGSARTFAIESPGVQKSVEEMLEVLTSDEYEVVCCRTVAHLTPRDQESVQLGRVRMVPEEDGPRSFERLIPTEIPAAPAAFGREPPFFYDPPHALLVIREATRNPDPYAVAERLSSQLERFLVLVRLLTAGTLKSHYEIRGTGTLVSRMRPHLELFLGAAESPVRRTVRPHALDAAAISALGEQLDQVEVVREGMVMTSFDVAVRKFNGAYYTNDLFGQLVDLATALEATLASSEADSAGLTLRLRSRAAALLATSDDPAPTIFKDVGLLYDLRSKLVHGGEVKTKQLRKTIDAISSVPPPSSVSGLRTMLGHAVDRMRDLVRRAIIARLLLAEGPDPMWPFDEQELPSVDGLLADDRARECWRSRWQNRLAELGASAAGSPPRVAVDFLSQEDR